MIKAKSFKGRLVAFAVAFAMVLGISLPALSGKQISAKALAQGYNTSGHKITNDYLAFQTSTEGRMALYTTGGNPDSSSDNNKRLLFGDLGSGSSKTILSIGGSTYLYTPYASYIHDNGESLYSYNTYNNVLVERYISFNYNTYTGRKDTIEIKFVFTNNSSYDVGAGARIFFDTMLGNNDSAPFKIPGKGDITRETQYTGSDIPQVWQVFDNLSNPTVVASGSFYTREADRPDKVQFMNYNSSEVYNLSISTSSSIGDSAVSIYYDPDTLSANQSRTIRTYYGLSQFNDEPDDEPVDYNYSASVSAMVPSEILTNDEQTEYEGNPFNFNGWVQNNGNQTLTNVKVTLGLPSGLSAQNLVYNLNTLNSGSNANVAWSITAQKQTQDVEFDYTVTVTANELSEPIVKEYSIFVPALRTQSGGSVNGDVWDGTTANGFGGGSGTESSPYLIYTAEQLAYLASSVNSGNTYYGKYFKLMSSIDLANIEWTPIGKGEQSTFSDGYNGSRVFSGNFDGNRFTVLNLKVTANTTSFNGLFGVTENATIKNLGVQGAVVGSNNARNYRVKSGALIGLTEGTSISNCFVDNAEVLAYSSSNPSAAGGLIGIIYSSSIKNCYANATSISNGHAAGLVGGYYGSGVSIIDSCYANGTATYDSSVYCSSVSQCCAGIVAFVSSSNSLTIRNCFFNGTINANSSTNSTIAPDGSRSNNYYNLVSGRVNTSGTSTSIDNLKSQSWISSNLGWDFSNVWEFNSSSEFPVLKGFETASFGHDESEWIYDVEPTCYTSGWRHTVCNDCGETVRSEYVYPVGHDYAITEEVEATCTADGSLTFTCQREGCGATKTQTLMATGHSFGDDNICDNCQFELVVHEHDYSESVVEATCTEMGYTVYTCGCGYSYRGDYVDQLGHRWDEGTVTQEATCSVDGLITYECTVCQATYTTTIPAKHAWTETVVTEKTCTTDGLISRHCESCGEEETEIIPAGHDWSEGEVVEEATCTEAGLVNCTCTVCGANENVEVPELGHHFVNGSCDRCGARIPDIVVPNEEHPEYGMYFEIDDILSNYGPDYINEYGVYLDHNEDAQIKKVAVFLTQDGTMWRRCIACVGDNITYATYVPYLSYDQEMKYTGLNSDWINIFRLSPNSDGIWCYSDYTTIGVNLADKDGNLLLSLYDIGQSGAKTRIFDDLEEMIQWLSEDSDCINHTVTDWTVDFEPTCLEEGLRHGTCSVCYLEVSEVMPLADCAWNYSGYNPTGCELCVDHAVAVCTVCGDELIAEGLGHDESDWIIDVYPTSSMPGRKHTECYRGGSIVSVDVIPMTATMTISSATVGAGATVTVTIDVQNNPGIIGAVLNLSYDNEGLTLIDVQGGRAWSTLSLTLPGYLEPGCSFVWDGVDEDDSNGSIITLTFQVSESAVNGFTYGIYVSYNSSNVVNGNFEPVWFDVVNGYITVDNLRGDANDDGQITVADVIALRRYLAGGYGVEINNATSDVNGDGEISIADVIMLRQYIVGGYGIQL